MPTARKAPGDVTGRASTVLSEKHQKELAARANEISILGAVSMDDDVIDIAPVDLTPPPPPAVIEVEAKTPEKLVEIRIVENIEMMTFGAGNYYNFEAGRKYRVVESLANHLAEKGYVWGM